MTILFPTQRALYDVFAPQSSFKKPKPQKTEPEARYRSPFVAFSPTEDAKSKAGQLGEGAVKEFEKASAKAQEKTGKIELYSAKYYAACTFGGLLACVS